MANVSSSNSQKALVPKLRFPGFEGEWTARKIKDFAFCYAGATPSTKESKYWENGTIPWLSSGEVNKKYIKGTDSLISECGFNSCSTKMVPADTVVMALAGQGKTRGNVAITEIPLCTNQSLAAIVTDNSVNNYCLLYFLETQYENLRLISSGDGTRGGLNLSLINNYTVTLPAVDEQNKLASFIYKLDQRIDSQRKLIESLKSYKRGVIQGLFSNRVLGNSTYSHWKEYAIKDLFSNIIDKNHPTEDVLTIIQGVGTVPRNSVERRISYDTAYLSTYKKVKQNDFILHLRSFEGGLEIANQDGLVSPAYTILRSKEHLIPSFFYAYFRSYEFISRKLRTTVEGIRDGKSINMDAFWNIKIPYPSLSEQELLSRGLSLTDKMMNAAAQKLSCMQALKRKLLADLFI